MTYSLANLMLGMVKAPPELLTLPHGLHLRRKDALAIALYRRVGNLEAPLSKDSQVNTVLDGTSARGGLVSALVNSAWSSFASAWDLAAPAVRSSAFGVATWSFRTRYRKQSPTGCRDRDREYAP